MGDRVHATGRMLFAEPVVVMLDAGEPQAFPQYRWIHCANEGEYRGHHQGEFELTRKVFESFVKNFREDPQYRAGSLELGGTTHTGGVRPVLQFDYEHASEMAATEGSIPLSGAPAVGWVLDVAIREGANGRAQLWAFAKLGDQIRGQISRDEYRSVSIAFTLQGRHFVTGAPIGPALTSIAFTNHPYMRDLEPFAAANRVTSQPDRVSVQPTNDPSVAPDGSVSPSPRTGATNMSETQLRDRVCRALKVHKLAEDSEVGAAVEEAAGAAGNLKNILESLGVPNADDAMKAIPQLRAAEGQLKKWLAEIQALLQQDVAVDAEVAKADVAGAMKAGGLTGSGAEKALGAFRNHLISEELSRIAKGKAEGEELMLSDQREARRLGREKFLAEYGVKTPDHQHLSTTLVAGPKGQQLQPPRAGQTLPIDERSDEGVTVIDLRGLPGNNTTEKIIAHLREHEQGFKSLPWDRQCARAGQVRRSAELTE